MPRYFFDIDDGEPIRDDEGHELVDLDAARDHIRRALSEILAHELRLGNAPRICVQIRNEAGEYVLTASGRGEVVIGEASGSVSAQREGEADDFSSSPLDRAAQYAIAARKAIDEDGCDALRHWADMLMWAIGRAISRRPIAAARPHLQRI